MRTREGLQRTPMSCRAAYRLFNTLPGALLLIEARKLKLVAVVSDAPLPGHPEFPLLTDLLPKDAVVGWNGIVVPAKTPRTIVARLNADFVAVIRFPRCRSDLRRWPPCAALGVDS